MKNILMILLLAGCSGNQSTGVSDKTGPAATGACLKNWSSQNVKKLSELNDARRVGAYALAARKCASTEEQMSKFF